MRLHDQVLSEEDFERLPPVLQRKVSEIDACPEPCLRVASDRTNQHYDRTYTAARRVDYRFHLDATQVFMYVQCEES